MWADSFSISQTWTQPAYLQAHDCPKAQHADTKRQPATQQHTVQNLKVTAQRLFMNQSAPTESGTTWMRCTICHLCRKVREPVQRLHHHLTCTVCTATTNTTLSSPCEQRQTDVKVNRTTERGSVWYSSITYGT